MSEVKTAQVEEILYIKEYDGKYGKTFYHEILLSNGDKGEIGKKVSGGVKVGDSITYTLETGEYGNKIKEVRDFNGNGNGGSKGGYSRAPESDKYPSFALSYAKDVVVAMIGTGEIKGKSSAEISAVIMANAEKYLEWLNAHK